MITGPNSEHPTELLTDLVDGSLSATEAARARTHLDRCEQCREEVRLASEARSVLTSLPEMVAPPIILPEALADRAQATRGNVVDFQRGERHWWEEARGRALAAGAGLVAAAFVIVVALSLGGDQFVGRGGGPESAATTHDTAAAAASGAPPLLDADRSYSANSVDQLARSLASGGDRLAEATSAAGSATRRVEDPFAVGQAVTCLRQGLGLTERDRPTYLERAIYQSKPVYLGAFENDGASPPANLLVVVVSRDDCSPLHVAQVSR